MGNSVAERIREIALKTMRGKVDVILFGSRVRDDWREDSDWDVLVLVDKDTLEEKDHTLYTYPFWELGWETGAMIHPLIYTKKAWLKRKGSEFYNNVNKEGIVLC